MLCISRNLAINRDTLNNDSSISGFKVLYEMPEGQTDLFLWLVVGTVFNE